MKDSGKKIPQKGINKSDLALWKASTGDVAPLEGADYLSEEDLPALTPKTDMPREHILPKRQEKAGVRAAQGRDLDRRTEEKFRTGRMEIEGRLDLHFMTQEEAHDALGHFIARSYEAGKRCVLLITGKGKGGVEGVLKRRVPVWLEDEKLRPMILSVAQAQQKDGGGGALYVLLRRQR